MPRALLFGLSVCLLLGATRAQARVGVSLGVPAAVHSGDILEVPVTIRDDREAVVSYALRVRYDRRAVHLVDIRGGTFGPFSASPITKRSAFGSGRVDFTAITKSFADTPMDFNVATLVFEVTGLSGDHAVLSIRRAPHGDITVLRGFSAVRLSVPHTYRIGIE
jgi:hypothetical protein